MSDLERYRRNISIDSIGEEGQLRLLRSKILVAGAGGLGSTVIANLASLGIGTLGIVDNDKLELSNLNRQYIHKYRNIGKNKAKSAEGWIKEYNPDINVEIYPVRLNKNNCKKIIADYDAVVDCFDSYESKFLLNEACVKQNKSLIHGGVKEFLGQVTTIIPHKTACLKCLFPENINNSYVAKGIASPTVSTIASIQSMEVLKLLLEIGEPLTNQLLVYNGLNQDFRKVLYKKDADCPVCA